MLITMDICYRKLKQSTKVLSEIDEWINGIRRGLKKKVVRKKEKEAVIARLYSYMHDIFGVEVIELFDMEYNFDEKYAKKEDAGQISKAAEQKSPENKKETESEETPKS